MATNKTLEEFLISYFAQHKERSQKMHSSLNQSVLFISVSRERAKKQI